MSTVSVDHSHQTNQTFRLGIMQAVLEEDGHERLGKFVDEAAAQVREKLTNQLGLDIEVFRFTGPVLSSTRGTYSPLDFLQLGLAEKLEREIHFLLIIVEVDLSSSLRSYVLALPSQLTNIGILSIKRLSPAFWGYPADQSVTTRRLTHLMLHTLGHLLNLDHDDSTENIMYAFRSVQDLNAMQNIMPAQVEIMHLNIPLEAHEEVTDTGRWAFALRHIVANVRIIFQSIRNANPLSLILRLPTVLTAAFSVIVVLFFTAEIWDVASVLRFGPLIIFSAVAICSSTAVFYAAFRIGPGQGRGELSESSVVMTAATLATLLSVNVMLYAIFFTVSVVSALTIFPEQLKATWPTAGEASDLIDQIKLGMFLATMGVLTGSLGGKADSRAIIQQVLFLDEET